MTIGNVAQKVMAQKSPAIAEQTNKTPTKSEHRVNKLSNDGHSAVNESHTGHEHNKAVKKEASQHQTKKSFGDWLHPSKAAVDHAQAKKTASEPSPAVLKPEHATDVVGLPKALLVSEALTEKKMDSKESLLKEKETESSALASDNLAQTQKTAPQNTGLLNTPAMAQNDFVALAQARSTLDSNKSAQPVGTLTDMNGMASKTEAKQTHQAQIALPLPGDQSAVDKDRSLGDATPFLKKLDLSSAKEQIKADHVQANEQLSGALLHTMPYKSLTAAASLSSHNQVAPTQTALNFKQLTQALNQRIESYRLHGADTSVIRLDPPHLGSIQIQLRHEGGQLLVQIVSERQDVANRLSDNANLLKNDLLKQDYQNVSIKVQCSGSQGTQSWQGQQNSDQSQQKQQQKQQQVGMALSQTSYSGSKASFLQEMK